MCHVGKKNKVQASKSLFLEGLPFHQKYEEKNPLNLLTNEFWFSHIYKEKLNVGPIRL